MLLSMKSSTWLKIAIALQLLTAFVHSLSFFSDPVAANDQEKMLIDLMYNYSMDLGAGYHRSMHEVVNALSACFSLVYLLGGAINWYLLRQRVEPRLLRGLLTIQVAVFGFAFALMLIYTFLPPIVLTGLCFIALVGSLLMIPKTETGT